MALHPVRINISLRLLECYDNDVTFMEMYAIWTKMKIQRRDSRIRFKNQKELLKKIGIGRSKWIKLQGHSMFNELFRMTESTFVARKSKYNGIQLTLSTECHNQDKKRIIIKLDKKKVVSTKYIVDKILEAKFVNYIRNHQKRLNSGELKTKDFDNKKSCSYSSLIDTVITNESIAKYLRCGITKAKEIASMAVRDNLVKKKKNIKLITKTYDPISFVEDNQPNIPIGKIFYVGNCVYWQIGNTWAMEKEGMNNRYYYGYKNIECKNYEFVHKKLSYGFFDESDEKTASFCNLIIDSVDNDEVIVRKEKTEEDEIAEKALSLAKESYGEKWDGYQKRIQQSIIRRNKRIIRAEKRRAAFDKYKKALNCFEEKYDAWTEEKKARAKTELSHAEACCSEIGTSIQSVSSRILRRAGKYCNGNYEMARDLYGEMAGELSYAVGAVSEDVYITYMAMKSKEIKSKYEESYIPYYNTNYHTTYTNL